MTVALLETLERLAPKAERFLLAVSGGGDSVALLRLAHDAGLTFSVAHIDHGLRPESAREGRFVEALCQTLGVPCHTARLEVAKIAHAKGWNLEDAARRLRYDALARTARRVGADAVLTAHTLDDQAETVLTQLLRGAAHLRGMPAQRGRVLRPLLGVSRQTLRDYLGALEQDYLEDSSNTDTARTRAWLRHDVLPRLEARYPQVKRTLARHAALQRDQADVLETLVAPLFPGDALEAAPLTRAAPALQRTALARLLRAHGVAPDLTQLDTLRAHLGQKEPFRLSLPGGKTLRLAYGRLEVVPTQETRQGSLQNAPHLPDTLDPDKLRAFATLHLRTRRPGDRIRLTGGSKKVSDLLIDRKVPRESRETLRVLALEPDGPSDVLWVEGVATDVRVARAAPDPDVLWMRRALGEAARAATQGEVPVGAVVAKGETLLGAAANATRTASDPTAHAELRALRLAAQHLGDWRLEGCTLYVTLEPCPMCLGAALSAHLPRLVYGAPNYREGALGGVADLRSHPWKRTLEVRRGLLAKEAETLLRGFFSAQRVTKAQK